MLVLEPLTLFVAVRICDKPPNAAHDWEMLEKDPEDVLKSDICKMVVVLKFQGY